ncbi:hypothetical protein [Deinococcus cellulosilyticus]|nr:hypothetical protein [Deinococcus cellulosilyticus]
MQDPVFIIGYESKSDAQETSSYFIDNLDFYKFLKTQHPFFAENQNLIGFKKPRSGVREHRSGDVMHLSFAFLVDFWLNDQTGIKDLIVGAIGGFIMNKISKGKIEKVKLRFTKILADGTEHQIDVECDKSDMENVKKAVRDALSGHDQ